MPSIITDAMRLRNAKAFLQNIQEQNDTFVFIGRPEPWSNDNNPPNPTGSLEEQKKVYQSITSYKPITSSDVVSVTHRFNWTSGFVYKMFDDRLSPNSQQIPAGTYPYYVLNKINEVFVCVYNGTSPSSPNGTPSIDEPHGTENTIFIGPNDRYVWKYLYTLSSESIEKHLSTTYLPVEQSTISSTPGEVISVYPETTGSNMASNIVTAPYYFCRIIGDGVGAVMRFSIINGIISSYEVVRNGSGYTYATVDMVDGRIYSSLDNLDNGTVPISIGGVKPSFRIILPPPGGYTSDTSYTLSAYYLSVNTEIKYGYQISGGDLGFFTQMKFRQYGIIDKPLLPSNQQPEKINYIGCYSVKMLSGSGNYTYGETITQVVGNKLAKGFVVHWDQTNKVLFYIQTQELHVVDGEIIRFSGNSSISGLSSNTTYVPDSSFTGTVPTTGVEFVGGYASPQLQTNGNILYLNNISPIQRSNEQIENLKFIIKF